MTKTYSIEEGNVVETIKPEFIPDFENLDKLIPKDKEEKKPEPDEKTALAQAFENAVPLKPVRKEASKERAPLSEAETTLMGEIQGGVNRIRKALERMNAGDPRISYLQDARRDFYDLKKIIEKSKFADIANNDVHSKWYKSWNEFASKEGYVYTNVEHELSKLAPDRVQKFSPKVQLVHREVPAPVLAPAPIKTPKIVTPVVVESEPQKVPPAEVFEPDDVVVEKAPNLEVPSILEIREMITLIRAAISNLGQGDSRTAHLMRDKSVLYDLIDLIEQGKIEKLADDKNYRRWMEISVKGGDYDTVVRELAQPGTLEQKEGDPSVEVKAGAEQDVSGEQSLPLETLPPPLPSAAERRLISVGITPEMIASIPELKEVTNSEAKVVWLLDKFDQIKVRTIREDAVADFEKESREISVAGGFGKLKGIVRNIGRKGLIEAKAQEHAAKEFSFDKYKNDLTGLAHLANASPDMAFQEKDGKREVVAQYLQVEGVHPRAFTIFNEAANAYAKLPPEHEWRRLPSKEQKAYKVVKDTYKKQIDEALISIQSQFATAAHPDSRNGRIGREGSTVKKYSEADAMRFVSDAELSLKRHQYLNSCPDAELELHKLAQRSKWGKGWEIAKTQLGIAGTSGAVGGGFGFVAGAAGLRWGVKSSLVMAGATAALPFAAIGLGGLIGWKRGGMKAVENIQREEELMRLGKEEKKNKNGTGLNFVDASSLTKKLSDLKEFVGVKYDDYVKNPGVYGPGMSLEEFNEAKRDNIDRLNVRLEYTIQKLGERKIVFGKKDGEDSSVAKYNLFKEISEANANLKFESPQTEKKFVGRETGTERTRKGRLGVVLQRAEELIEESRDKYVTNQKIKGLATGLLLGSAGFYGGQAIGGYVREFVHDVQLRIHELKAGDFVGAKNIENAVIEVAKAETVHSNMEALLEQTSVVPSSEGALPVITPLNESFEPAKPIVSPTKVLKPTEIFEQPKTLSPQKAFQFKLTNETQSREFALKKYYESKGVGSLEAGKKANLDIKRLFPRGENKVGWVHKGDNISIIEDENGKPKISVIRKGVPEKMTSERIIAKTLPRVSFPELVPKDELNSDNALAPRIDFDSRKFKFKRK